MRAIGAIQIVHQSVEIGSQRTTINCWRHHDNEIIMACSSITIIRRIYFIFIEWRVGTRMKMAKNLSETACNVECRLWLYKMNFIRVFPIDKSSNRVQCTQYKSIVFNNIYGLIEHVASRHGVCVYVLIDIAYLALNKDIYVQFRDALNVICI